MSRRHFDKDRVKALIDGLRPSRRTRVVDIGANPINDCPYADLLALGACDVWGFEPHPEAFAKLRPSEREHYLPHAVGRGARETFHICRSDAFSSLLPPNRATLDALGRWHKAMTVTETVEVETRALDDLDDLPMPDLLKIDVQGAEREVFAHGRKKLAGAVAVISEVAFVPLYEGQPLLDAQMAELGGQGFTLHKFMFLKSKTISGDHLAGVDWRRHQNQLIDGDAVFIRSLAQADGLEDEQLKHLAILADAVFESFDVALWAVCALHARGAVTREAVGAYSAAVPHQRAVEGAR